jgi:hypothetical protein
MGDFENAALWKPEVALRRSLIFIAIGIKMRVGSVGAVSCGEHLAVFKAVQLAVRVGPAISSRIAGRDHRTQIPHRCRSYGVGRISASDEL